MPETLKRIRDLSAVTDPTGMSFPLDAAALGAAESQRITADAFFTWIASQLDIPVVSGSSGYIQFNTSDELNSSANLFWNNSTNRLGINTTSPSVDLDVRGRILADRTAVTSLSNPNQYSISVTNFNTDGGVGYAEMSLGVASDGALIQTLGGVDLWLNRTGNTIKTGGNFVPGTTSSYGLGTTSLRWATAFIDTLTLTNALGATSGGTGQTTYAAGDILYASATNTLSKLTGNASTTSLALVMSGNGSVPTTIGWTTYTATVSNSDGTLTISPTSGAVVASLNLAHLNTWTVTQVFSQATGAGISVVMKPATGSPTGDIFQITDNAGSTVYDVCDSIGNMFPYPVTFGLAAGTAATTGTNLTFQVIMPSAGKILKAWAKATTGPTGADLIFDINLNGSTIWSTQANRLKIVAGATTGNTTTFNTTTFAAGDLFTIDIDQVGSTIAGQDITVMLFCVGTNNGTNSGNAASGSIT